MDMPISDFVCRLQFYLANQDKEDLAKSVDEEIVLHYLNAQYAEAIVTDGMQTGTLPYSCHKFTALTLIVVLLARRSRRA